MAQYREQTIQNKFRQPGSFWEKWQCYHHSHHPAVVMCMLQCPLVTNTIHGHSTDLKQNKTRVVTLLILIRYSESHCIQQKLWPEKKKVRFIGLLVVLINI